MSDNFRIKNAIFWAVLAAILFIVNSFSVEKDSALTIQMTLYLLISQISMLSIKNKGK